MRTTVLAGGLVVAVSILGAADALAQSNPPRYAVTDLGDLGGGETVASSINSSGQIVGTSYLPGHTVGNSCDERRAFLYEKGVMTELPSLPGTRFATAAQINQGGDVAGTNYVYVADASCTGGCIPGYCEAQTPVLVRSGQAVDLSAPWPWYAGIASDVNSSGQVVGWSRKADLPNPRTWHGYLWENGVRTDLGTLDRDWSIATSINDDGLVVGYSQLLEGGGEVYGFRWNGGAMTPLPALGANTYNGANQVNAAGEAVGWSGPTSSETRPVFYPATGGVLDLGSLGGTQSSAYAMNDRGSVVGYSYTAGDLSRHAFLHRGGQLFDLNDLLPAGAGWELIAATDVNNVGQIVGYGCKDSRFVPPGDCVDESGTRTLRRSFLLTPAVSIQDLQDMVRSFDLPRRLEISLLSKLFVAQILIDAGYTGLGCRVLGAFGDQVEDEKGNGLTASQAALLLETLALVRADSGCS